MPPEELLAWLRALPENPPPPTNKRRTISLAPTHQGTAPPGSRSYHEVVARRGAPHLSVSTRLDTPEYFRGRGFPDSREPVFDGLTSGPGLRTLGVVDTRKREIEPQPPNWQEEVMRRERAIIQMQMSGGDGFHDYLHFATRHSDLSCMPEEHNEGCDCPCYSQAPQSIPSLNSSFGLDSWGDLPCSSVGPSEAKNNGWLGSDDGKKEHVGPEGRVSSPGIKARPYEGWLFEEIEAAQRVWLSQSQRREEPDARRGAHKVGSQAQSPKLPFVVRPRSIS